MKDGKAKRPFYTKQQIKILFTCAMVFGAMAGMIVNCNGQFYRSIADALGVTVGQVTISTAIMGVVSFFATTLIVKLYSAKNPRIVAATLILSFCLAHMSTAFVTQLWQYYLISAIRGVSYGFLIYYFNSSTIKSWFGDHAGVALSISALMSGVIGIIFNLVIGVMIEHIGWRASIAITSVLAAAMALPGVLLFLDRAPGTSTPPASSTVTTEKAAPAPSSSTAGKAAPAPSVTYDATFFLGLILCILWIFSGVYNQHLKVHALSKGCTQMFSASLISVAMAGNLTSKLVFGSLSDRIGPVKTAVSNAAVIIAALVLLILPFGNVSLAAGAFLIGAGNAFATIIIPQVVSYVYQGNRFGPVYSKYSMFFAITGNLWSSAMGSIYSATGSYAPVFSAGIGLVLISLLILPVFLRGRKGISAI